MFEQLPSEIDIIEVGPRDGLQNEKQPIATEDKLCFIDLLAESGLKTIEVSSFVKPEAIPQLADSAMLVPQVLRRPYAATTHLPCLVPNARGMESAVAAKVKEVAVFVATSDAFSKRNINATVDESYDRIAPVFDMAKQHGIRVRGYLSTVFGCPYEGDIAPAKVLDGVRRLLALGCYEVSLGDTIGIGEPRRVQEVLKLLLQECTPSQLAMHFHDTRGLALPNILVSLEMGIRRFDASAGGIGGCPYAKGASGNVATEDVVYLMERMGVRTGVDSAKVAAAAAFMLKLLGKTSPSKMHRLYAEARTASD